MGSLLIQEAKIIRYLFLKNHLDLECMRKSYPSFLMYFGFHFSYRVPDFLLRKQNFGPSDSQSICKQSKTWVCCVFFFYSKSPDVGLCSHGLCLSMFRYNIIKRCDLLITKAAAKKEIQNKWSIKRKTWFGKKIIDSNLYNKQVPDTSHPGPKQSCLWALSFLCNHDWLQSILKLLHQAE